jgi:hypothetical protein
MKVGKEEVMGVLAAVEAWTKMDLGALNRLWEQRVKRIATMVETVPGVTTDIKIPEEGNRYPTLTVKWDEAAWKFSVADCDRQLRQGEPRIEVLTASNPSWFRRCYRDPKTPRDNRQIISMTMQSGRADVGRRLREILSAARKDSNRCHAYILILGMARARRRSPVDVLLKGGHVVDGKNGISAVRTWPSQERRGGRPEHCGVAGQADDRCFVALRDARGHARPRTPAAWAANIRRKLRSPGRLHLRRRDHGGGRGQFRLAPFANPRPDDQSPKTRVLAMPNTSAAGWEGAGRRAEHWGYRTGAYRRSGEAP